MLTISFKGPILVTVQDNGHLSSVNDPIVDLYTP